MDPDKQDIDYVDAEPRREHLADENHFLKAAWYDDLFVLYCALVYLADVITDILVSVKYFNNGDYIWFSLTLACILGASIVMMVFSLKWFYSDTPQEVSKTRTVIFHLFQLGPLRRYWNAYKTGRKTRKEHNSALYYNMFIEQWRDIAMLRLFEAFIESAPQLVLQLYILAYNRHFDEEEDWLTACSACSSLLSLSTSIVSYSKALRDARKDKGKMSWWAFACQLVWRLSMVASRIITLVLFASVYKSWILLVVGIHWISMIIWVYYQKTSFCENKKYLEQLFSVIIGFIYIFCFFNVKDGFTRRRLVAFYSMMFVEDCILMGLWLPYSHEYGVVFVIAVVWVFGGFFLGVVAMFLYYQFYHPSLPIQGICCRANHDVPSVEGIAYRYFCCHNCCHIRCIEDEISETAAGSFLCIDIPAWRGSVGRSVSNITRGTSPPFESELLHHEPSELQRSYSLEKHKIKQQKDERVHRSEASKTRQHSNGVPTSNQGDRDVTIDMCTTNGSCTGVHELEPGTSVLKSKKKFNNELHCGTDNGGDGDTGTNIMKTGTCDDGLHCGSDDEKEAVSSVVKTRTCDDGLHCGSDDENETGTSVVKTGTCDDGLHCGSDDEKETGTSVVKTRTCDDGLHCGSDDEKGTGTSVIKTRTCDDGLHCGSDDEKETGTSVVKTRTCDDGLHCGSDDEKETGTSVAKTRTCDDGLHCGSDDEKETGTSVAKTRICDDEEETKKGESMSHITKILPNKYPISLGFHLRYSIVSDCISLSSSSSDITEDEDPQQDKNTSSIQCTKEFNNDLCAENDSNNNSLNSSPDKKSSPRRNKQANRVSFPNFVSSNLNRGKFSSLRVSCEEFVEEGRTSMNKRHTVDFSQLTSDRTCQDKNKYVRFIQSLRPKKFGSVREKMQELAFVKKSCVELNTTETEKDIPDKCVQLRDTKGDEWSQMRVCGLEGFSSRH